MGVRNLSILAGDDPEKEEEDGTVRTEDGADRRA